MKTDTPWGLTPEKIEAFRKEQHIFELPGDEPWVAEENRVLNAICELALMALSETVPTSHGSAAVTPAVGTSYKIPGPWAPQFSVEDAPHDKREKERPQLQGMGVEGVASNPPQERTHLDVWKDVWSVYCECFRENFGDHPVELSPVALEAFAIRIQEAVRQDFSATLHTQEGACPTCQHPFDTDVVGSLEWHRLHVERELWILAVIEELEAARRGVAVTHVMEDPLERLKHSTGTADSLRVGLEIHERAVAAKNKESYVGGKK